MNKSAVVTGASSGIGLGLSQLLAEDGYRVLMMDIHADRLAEAAASVGAAAETFAGDIADPSVCTALADAAFDRFGTVDLVFANAGIGMTVPLIEATADQFDTVFNINTKGAWLSAQAFARRWIDTGASGRLCLTGSEHSIGFQHAGSGLYTASKHALLGLADVLRHELPESISVSVLCPGLAATNIYDARHVPGTALRSERAIEFSKAIMDRGMSPREVARHAIDYTLQGEFLIFTHAVSRPPADTRWQEIDRAFRLQAPPGPDDDKYDVNKVVADVRAAFKSRQ